MQNCSTRIGAIAVSAVLSVAAGCATTRDGAMSTTSEAEPVASASQEHMERALQAESEVARLKAELAAKEQAASTAAASAPEPAADAALLPPNAKPGECYARVLLPAKYETSTQEIVKRPASERIEVIPARYETAQERVLVREASTRLEVVPAVYEEVSEQVLARPASKKLVEVPAQYETTQETVLVRAGYTTWKRGPATVQSGRVQDERVTDTGEIMCLVEVPPVYETIPSKKLVSPATTREIEIPAEYKTVVRRVVKTPATTRQVEIPAEYGTVTVTKLVSPAEERRIPVPAEYQSVSTRKLVADAKVEWRQILCATNQTPDLVVAIQEKLKEAGEYSGPLDGIMGRGTLAAANSYASAKGLPTGANYITTDVVRALNVSR